MNSIKTPLSGLKRLAAGIRGMQIKDKEQKRALANAAFFFALILAFTLIARGTEAAKLPMITLVSAQRMELVQKISAYGTVDAQEGVPQELAEGLTVEKVFIAEGQTVKQGDGVAQFSADEVAERLAREKVALQKLQLSLALLEKKEYEGGNLLRQTELAVVWAKQDLGKLVGLRDLTYDDLQDAYDDARDELTNAQAELERVKKDKDATEEELEQARSRVTAAMETLSATYGALTGESQNLEGQITVAERALANAQAAYDAAKDAAERSSEAAKEQADQNALEAKLVRLDMARKQQEIEALTQLYSDGGLCRAQADGTVVKLALTAGQKTAEGAAFQLFGSEDWYRLSIPLTDKEAEMVLPGMTVTVTQGNTRVPAQIASVSPNENGSAAVIRLPQTGFTKGWQALAEMELSRTAYRLCVPLSAVRSESGGDYVLVLQEQNSILGVQSMVYRLPVTVIDTDTANAAIEGALFGDMQVVSASTKPVDEGDRVRLLV